MNKYALVFQPPLLCLTALIIATSNVKPHVSPLVVTEEVADAAPAVTNKLTAKDKKPTPLKLNKEKVMFLTSEVTPLSVDLIINDLIKFNEANAKEVYLILDTPGGSVIAGARLITAIEGSKAKVNCVVTGMAASMGFQILQHCNQRMGTPDSFIMSHPASVSIMYQGELDKLVSHFSFMQLYVEKLDRYAANQAKMDYNEYKLRASREMWIDTQDAIREGFMDKAVYVNLPAISELNTGTNKNTTGVLTFE